ncbi:PAS domain S-box-containing protein/diguanylate cyclase (GGDEF) domain-containing protein [Paenibacillus sp. UNC496MF]|uniref:PAS domain S-box protein n=1 Tax=Paenibacillus sp. UNC496MF TaxID=1502753 RepID=UPI0008E814BA|nr:PAS domain S-box protein [Paenibacillus sp. UNC496MF]SFJ12036.1 PAS domain S-box-containing protein/diguanylate cyclase (GGDEF) domain-containing protein [Paenibacillus sp. UNC496MF]
MNAMPLFERKPTLNDKLRSLGLVFVLIVGCACTLIFSYIEFVNQRQNIHHQLQQTLLLQQQFIDKWLGDRLSDIRVVANYPALKDGDAANANELIALMQRNHAEFRSLSLVGPDGSTPEGLNVGDRDYFAAAKQGTETVSDVLRSLKDGTRIIVFAVPVQGDDGTFKGVAMGAVELTTVEQLLDRFTYGKQGQTYLVDRDGTLITGEGSGSDKPVRIGEGLLADAKAGIGTVRSYDNYCGIPVYGDYRWTKDGSWLIVGEAAKKDVYASLYTELKYASLFLLLAMLAAVLVMLRTSKKIAMPVNHLLRGVRHIREGGYHYRIEPGALEASTVEFRQLGLTFNAMADTVLEHTEALRGERNFAASIVDTAASLIVVLDDRGHILRFNRSCELATGYAFDELRGASIYDKLIPDEERADVEARLRGLLADGGSTANENHWRSRDGKRRLIAWSNTMLQEPGGARLIIGIGIDITEQRKVEQELKASEERFRLIVGSMDEVVTTYDAELKQTGIHGRTVVHDGGLFRNRYEGRTIREVLDPFNAGLHEDAQRLALEEKASVVEWTVPGSGQADGADRHFQTSYSTLRGNGGEPSGVVSVTRDITPLKEAEAAYRESQARIRSVLESITDAFMAFDNDGTLAYVNGEAERMLGQDRSAVLGRPLREAFPEAAEAALADGFRKAADERTPVSAEAFLPRLNAWYEMRIYPSREGLSVYFQDVSSRKELEQAARESRLRLVTIIETVPSGIIVVEEDGMISMANRMAEDIFGLSKTSIEGRAFRDPAWNIYGLDGERLAPEAYPVSLVMRTGRPVSNYEYVFERPDGERVMLSCNCSPVLDGFGRLRSVLVSLSDITGRIAIQTKLQEANDELRKLSSLDGLTGVFNRRYFNEQLRAEWNRHALRKEPLSLILLDIDYFKAYNDTYGHLGGDMCLRTVASLLRAALKQPDRFVARYGGEEFAVVLPGTDGPEAAALAETLRAQVEGKEIAHANSKVSRFVTISLGVATVVPAFGSEEEALVSDADKCLYEAKRARNRVSSRSGMPEASAVRHGKSG